jgi:hypothetical protein
MSNMEERICKRVVSQVEDEMIGKIAKKAVEELKNKICRRCHNLLEEDEKNNFCKRCWEIEKDTRKMQRETQKKYYEIEIENVKEQIRDKQDQVDTNKVREVKYTVKSQNGEVSIIEGYIDQLKPPFLLKTEINHLNNQIDMFKKQIEGLKKAQKDEDTNFGSKGTASD